MQMMWWLIAALLAFLLGLLVVQYLSVHPLRMSLALSAVWLVLFGLSAALSVGFRGQAVLPALAIAVFFFLAGYLCMAGIVLREREPAPLPVLSRAASDPGLGHTAVVYFSHGEPETYDPGGWIKQFQEFDSQGIKFVPFAARPFFLHSLRARYLKVGRSGHRRMHLRMIAALENAYRLEGDRSLKFYPAFLDDQPAPDAAVIQALNDGASRIIVCEVFLTISNHTAEGKRLVRDLRLEEITDVPVCFTGPLYDSEQLKRMFVERADANLGGTPREKVGILLVGHGQPDEWDAMWPTETEQELSFRCSVLDLLEANGYRRENLSLAWAAFKEPRPASVVKQFLQNGVEKLLFFSAAVSAEAILSQVDIPDLVHAAEFPDGFPVIDLCAWNDDPLVIQAIKTKIDACLP